MHMCQTIVESFKTVMNDISLPILTPQTETEQKTVFIKLKITYF